MSADELIRSTKGELRILKKMASEVAQKYSEMQIVIASIEQRIHSFEATRVAKQIDADIEVQGEKPTLFVILPGMVRMMRSLAMERHINGLSQQDLMSECNMMIGDVVANMGPLKKAGYVEGDIRNFRLTQLGFQSLSEI